MGAVQVVGEKIYRNLVEKEVYINIDFTYSRSFQENTMIKFDFNQQLSLLNYGMNKFIKRYKGDSVVAGSKVKLLVGIDAQDCLIKYNYVQNEIKFTGMQRQKILSAGGTSYTEYSAVNLPIQMWKSRKAQEIGAKQKVLNWGEIDEFDQHAEYFQDWNFESYNNERNDPGNMHTMMVGDNMEFCNHDFDDVWYAPSSVYDQNMASFFEGLKIQETASTEEASIFPILPFTHGYGNGEYTRFFWENSDPSDASAFAVSPFLSAADPKTVGLYTYQQLNTPKFVPNTLWNVAVVPSIEAGGSQSQGEVYYDITSRLSFTLCIPKINKRKYGSAEHYDTATGDKMIFKHPWMSRTIKGTGITDQAQLEKYKTKESKLAGNLTIQTKFGEIYNGTETLA